MKNNKIQIILTLVFVLSLFFLPGIAETSATYNLKDYYPLNQGDSWLYEDEDGVYMESKVSGTEMFNELKATRIIEKYVKWGQTIKNFEYLSVDESNLRVFKFRNLIEYEHPWTRGFKTEEGYQEKKVKYEEKILSYEPPLTIPTFFSLGETKTYKTNKNMTHKDIDPEGNILNSWSWQTPITEKVTLEKIETITTAAGIFNDCLKIRHQGVEGEGDGTWTTRDISIWLAKDVGMVKVVNNREWGGQDRNKELIFATINGNDIGVSVAGKVSYNKNLKGRQFYVGLWKKENFTFYVEPEYWTKADYLGNFKIRGVENGTYYLGAALFDFEGKKNYWQEGPFEETWDLMHENPVIIYKEPLLISNQQSISNIQVALSDDNLFSMFDFWKIGNDFVKTIAATEDLQKLSDALNKLHKLITEGKTAVDTTPPEALKAVSINNTSVDIVFSEKIKILTAEDIKNYSIINLSNNSILEVKKASLSLDEKVVRLTTASQEKDVPYQITINTAITDLNGNSLKPGLGDRVSFAGKIKLALPLAPAIISAKPDGPGTIIVKWEDKSLNEEGFIIERKKPEGEYEKVNTLPANSIAYRDTHLSPNTTYFYRIYAFNSQGNSPYSNSKEVTTTGLPPVRPTSLTAKAISNTQIVLNWVDESDNEKGFRIMRKLKDSSGDFENIADVGTGITSYTDNIATGNIYCYYIKAYNDSGDSLGSNWVYVKAEVTYSVSGNVSGVADPTKLYISALNIGSNIFNLWSIPKSDGSFKIENIPAGTYVLRAYGDKIVNPFYNNKKEFGEATQITVNENKTGINFNLTIDSKAPEGSISFKEGDSTKFRYVTINLNVSDNYTSQSDIEYQISNDGTNYTNWKKFGEEGIKEVVWALSQGKGEKTVYVRFMDKCGNISIPPISGKINYTQEIADIKPEDIKVNLATGDVHEDKVSKEKEVSISRGSISAGTAKIDLNIPLAFDARYVTVVLKADLETTKTFSLVDPDNDRVWTGKIDDIEKGELILEITMSDGSILRVNIGTIKLIDPSGYVYNIVNNQKVPGAKVTLYYFNINTGKYEVANYPNPKYSPAKNPLYTNSEGHYAWDVEAGRYYVKVEANWYETVEQSRIVDIPPEVTDLHIGLTPIDKGNPTANFTFIDKNNQEISTIDNIEVILKLNLSDDLSGISKVMFSNNANFSDGVWKDYAKEIYFASESGVITYPWTLSEGKGAKTVYLKVMDNCGNIQEANKSITVEPRGPSFSFHHKKEGDTIKVYVTSTKRLMLSGTANILQYSINNEQYDKTALHISDGVNYVISLNLQEYKSDLTINVKGTDADGYANTGRYIIKLEEVKTEKGRKMQEINFTGGINTEECRINFADDNSLLYIPVGILKSTEDGKKPITFIKLDKNSDKYKSLAKDALSDLYKIELGSLKIRDNIGAHINLTINYTQGVNQVDRDKLNVYRLVNNTWSLVYAPDKILDLGEKKITVKITNKHFTSLSSSSQSLMSTTGNSGIFAVFPQAPVQVSKLTVYNYPNPFHPDKDANIGTTIVARFPKEAKLITAKIYNIAGELIWEYEVSESNLQGLLSYDKPWSGKNDLGQLVGTGVYILRVNITYKDDTRETKFHKIVINHGLK